jgi:hypothetical protein
MYTSSAHFATHIYLMARTDRNAPKHEGISIFLFPMDTPGITVRPLWTIQNDPTAPTGTTYGNNRTNETFYDDVRIHKSCLLGEENKGWRVGSMGLNLDRVGASRYLISVRRDEDIVNWVKSNTFDGFAPGKDPAIRDKIAEMWIEAQVCRLMTMRSMSIVERGGKFTYEGSAEKVWRGRKCVTGDPRCCDHKFAPNPPTRSRTEFRAQRDGRPVRDQSRQRAGDARPVARRGPGCHLRASQKVEANGRLSERCERLIAESAREFLDGECPTTLVRAMSGSGRLLRKMCKGCRA